MAKMRGSQQAGLGRSLTADGGTLPKIGKKKRKSLNRLMD